MDFLGKKKHENGDTIINIDQIIVNFGEEKEHHHHGRKMKPLLTFNILTNNTNCKFMAIVTNLTLTSVAPVELSMAVNDANNGNAPIAGVLSNLTYNVDATQDIAVVDSANPLDVDIHAVSLQGGSTVTGTGTFVSTALQADNVTPLFSGTVTGTLVLVNNIVVAVLNPVLTFNQ